jgi:cytochrome c5
VYKSILAAFLALTALALTATASIAAVELTEEQRAAVAARIAPAGEVCVQGESCGGVPAGAAAAAGAGGAVAAVDGESTYNMACMACHASGAGGAPIVGDSVAWAPRIAKGTEALHNSGVNGVTGTGMMAKGGRADLSDQAVIAAVDYMIANSQ